jgi:hypothetical protein
MGVVLSTAVDTWLVERYLPDATEAQVDDAASRLAAASLTVAAEGIALRYLGTTFVAGEEYCVCRFAGGSIEDVRRACDAAGISYARIVEARELEARR